MNTTLPPPSTHQPWVNMVAAAPEILNAMLSLNPVLAKSGLERSLLELVKLRASQINRCAFCLEMHAREAKQAGEREERLHLLNAWEEAGVFTPREQAALRWTEALTRLSEGGVSDQVFEAARSEFSDTELSHLTLAVVVINGWNRFNVGFRVTPRFGG